jgi:hypothetical protein
VLPFVGVVMIAVALSGSLAMHNYVKTEIPCSRSPIYTAECMATGESAKGSLDGPRPDWVDPVAISVAVVGIGFGVLLIARPQRRA